jgi:hypothetical protein
MLKEPYKEYPFEKELDEQDFSKIIMRAATLAYRKANGQSGYGIRMHRINEDGYPIYDRFPSILDGFLMVVWEFHEALNSNTVNPNTSIPWDSDTFRDVIVRFYSAINEKYGDWTEMFNVLTSELVDELAHVETAYNDSRSTEDLLWKKLIYHLDELADEGYYTHWEINEFADGIAEYAGSLGYNENPFRFHCEELRRVYRLVLDSTPLPDL